MPSELASGRAGSRDQGWKGWLPQGLCTQATAGEPLCAPTRAGGRGLTVMSLPAKRRTSVTATLPTRLPVALASRAAASAAAARARLSSGAGEPALRARTREARGCSRQKSCDGARP
jgi:hypothetical protein